MTDTTSPTPTGAPTITPTDPTVHATDRTDKQDSSRGFGIASVVLGASSLLAGWTFIAPIVGLVLGIVSRRRTPESNEWATAGIILNIVVLAGWLIIALGIATIGLIGVGIRFLS